MNLKCQSLSFGILFLFSVITKEQFTTVPLKSKLTLETRPSRLDPRASMLETFESRGSRNKAFSNMQKLERVSRKRFISQRKNNTVLLTPTVKYKCFASIVIA